MNFHSLLLSLFPQKDFILELHHSPISTLCQLLLVGKGHARPTTTVTAARSGIPPCTCKRPCSWSSGGLAGLQGWVELTAGSADAALVSDMLCVCACVLSPCSTSPWHEPLQWICICCACENLWWCQSAPERQFCLEHRRAGYPEAMIFDS